MDTSDLRRSRKIVPPFVLNIFWLSSSAFQYFRPAPPSPRLPRFPRANTSLCTPACGLQRPERSKRVLNRGAPGLPSPPLPSPLPPPALVVPLTFPGRCELAARMDPLSLLTFLRAGNLTHPKPRAPKEGHLHFPGGRASARVSWAGLRHPTSFPLPHQTHRLPPPHPDAPFTYSSQEQIVYQNGQPRSLLLFLASARLITVGKGTQLAVLGRGGGGRVEGWLKGKTNNSDI